MEVFLQFLDALNKPDHLNIPAINRKTWENAWNVSYVVMGPLQ
jgi:hypothetical protein